MFHDKREVKLTQFKPARAKKKIVAEEMDKVRHHSTEQKIDGERYLVQTHRPTNDGGYLHGVTSRRESVVTGRFVEKTDRVPHITQMDGLPSLSMFDCEFVSSGDIKLVELPGLFWDKLDSYFHPHMEWLRTKFDGAIPVYPHVGNTVSIMGSDGPLAVKKQAERGFIWGYAFDILQYEGKSLLANAQSKRRAFLAKQLEPIHPENGLVLMPAWNSLTLSEKEELFSLLTDPEIGGEGLIFKDPTLPYNHARAWWKLKKEYPCDVVLTGEFDWGKEGKTGKMVGKVGTLEIGVYHNDDILPIGWISAIMDSEAKLQSLTDQALSGEIVGRPLECRHNGLQAKPGEPLGYTLRHPRFRRWRDDKNSEDCTWTALQEEVK